MSIFLLLIFLLSFSYDIKSIQGQQYPPQRQPTQPGKQYLMRPPPISINPQYKPSNRLQGKVALVTGGDSGIGRSVCYHYALEGATVAFTYVQGEEERDTNEALDLIRRAKTPDAGDPIAIPTDFRRKISSKLVVDQVVKRFGRIDILVNNAAFQPYSPNIENATETTLRDTFEINIFAYYYMARYSLPYMGEWSSIINTASITAYVGSAELLEYSMTKGAIVTFTRSLSLQLEKRKIRVNGVAPGPIWTALTVSSWPAEVAVNLGSRVPMNRIAEPYEIAPSYVFLASNASSSYISGQVIHPNGGYIVNG